MDISSFLFGFCVGSLLFGTLVFVFLRQKIVAAHRAWQMINHSVSRAAKADKKRMQYEEELMRSLDDSDRLRNEKLRNWDIPEEY